MFSLEQLPEIVRLDVDVHMAALHPERAVTRSPLQNTVVGTGWRTLDARKALRKEPRVVKTVSSDSYFAGHTASLLFQRSISARHRKKMTPDLAHDTYMAHAIIDYLKRRYGSALGELQSNSKCRDIIRNHSSLDCPGAPPARKAGSACAQPRVPTC